MTRIHTIFFALVLLSACGGEDKPKGPTATTVDPASVPVREVVGIGKVEPENEIIKLAATSGGIIKAVYKNDGEAVRAGDLLLQLDDDIEQVRIRQGRSQISTQQAQVSVEQAGIRESEARLGNKRRQLAESKTLVDKGAETRDAYQDLVTEVRALEGKLEQGRASVTAAERRIGELREELRLAETEAAQKMIRAPNNGIILDMQVSKGESIGQFATYAEFAPEGRTIVRAEVDELYSDKVKPGQSVDIRYTGTAQSLARGEVLSVGAYLKKKSLFSVKADDQEDRRVLEVRIALPDSAKLTINTKVECIIKLQP
jgi:multidrug resistance efflux pump